MPPLYTLSKQPMAGRLEATRGWPTRSVAFAIQSSSRPALSNGELPFSSQGDWPPLAFAPRKSGSQVRFPSPAVRSGEQE